MGKDKNTLAATAMVELIRDLIKQEMSKEDNTAVCTIISCNPDGTYDIAILPDTITVIKAVKSITPERLKIGDFAYIFKFKNALNNAVILTKIGGTGADVRFLGLDALEEENTGILNSLASTHYVQEAIENLHLGTAAQKNAGNSVGNVPLIGSDGKLSSAIIPFSAGDMIFGGVLIDGGDYGHSDSVACAVISSELAAALEITEESVIYLVDGSTDDPSSDPPEYGYATLSNYYFIAQDSGDFHGSSISTGDKVLSTGSGWQVIANDTPYLLLAGGTMTGGITLQRRNTSLYNTYGLLFGTSGAAGRITSSVDNSGTNKVLLLSSGEMYIRIGATDSSHANKGMVFKPITSGGKTWAQLYPTKFDTDDYRSDLGSAANPWHNFYVDAIILSSGDTIATQGWVENTYSADDTKNTAGSTDKNDASKVYLIFGTEQNTYVTTYSNSDFYFDTTSGTLFDKGGYTIYGANVDPNAGTDYVRFLSDKIQLTWANDSTKLNLSFPTDEKGAAGTTTNKTLATQEWTKGYYATDAHSGVVSTVSQNFAGYKSFGDSVGVSNYVRINDDQDEVRNILGLSGLTNDYDLFIGSLGFYVDDYDAESTRRFRFIFPHISDTGAAGKYVLATTDIVASDYSSSSSYAVGDYCIYNGSLYRCSTAIASPGEAWNSAHWTSITVTDELKNKIGVHGGSVESDFALTGSGGEQMTFAITDGPIHISATGNGDVDIAAGQDIYLKAGNAIYFDEYALYGLELTASGMRFFTGNDDIYFQPDGHLYYGSPTDAKNEIATIGDIPGDRLPEVRVTSLSKPIIDGTSTPYFDLGDTMYLNVVLRGGYLKAGDEITICERTKSKWNRTGDHRGRNRYRYRVVKKYTITSSDIEAGKRRFSIPIVNNQTDDYVFHHNNSRREAPATRFVRVRRVENANSSIFSNVITINFKYGVDNNSHGHLTMI